MIVDFTSSLYLGLNHPRSSLEDWAQLTTGVPAVLGEPPVVGRVVAQLTRLLGVESVQLASSTLHVAWDLAEMITRMRARVVVDHAAYPILRLAAEIARGRGTSVQSLRAHDPSMLEHVVRGSRGGGPVVVITDGFCLPCRRVAPIAEYAAIVRDTGGFVVVDDTQALGVLGAGPSHAKPYGLGGAGSLAWTNSAPDGIVVAASLAKGFGAPIAMIAGSRDVLREYTSASKTRSHCSPPSSAALHAADRALTVNRTVGDRLRARLAANVREFRRQMQNAGAQLEPDLFPVQTLQAPRGEHAAAICHHLSRSGVRALLTSPSRCCDKCARDDARLTFVLNSRLEPGEIRYAADSLRSALTAVPSPTHQSPSSHHVWPIQPLRDPAHQVRRDQERSLVQPRSSPARNAPRHGQHGARAV